MVVSGFRSSALIALLGMLAVANGFGQRPAAPSAEKTPPAGTTSKDDKKPTPTPNATVSAKEFARNPTAEIVVESVIFIYGLGGGRATLNQIRKTALERGKMSLVNDDGKIDQVTYSRWTQRAETLNKEKIRLDRDFPNARYALVFNEKIFGIVDDQVFVPREDASKAFENQIVHGLEALLRYKENESKLAMNGKDKIMGVDYYVVDVTDKLSRKTRFYISAKTFRVMMLDYEEEGVKYRRKFYDYNYAQGTLVPFKTILWAGDRVIEETEIGTITYGQKIDEAMFSGERG